MDNINDLISEINNLINLEFNDDSVYKKQETSRPEKNKKIVDIINSHITFVNLLQINDTCLHPQWNDIRIEIDSEALTIFSFEYNDIPYSYEDEFIVLSIDINSVLDLEIMDSLFGDSCLEIDLKLTVL